jgi:ParB family chromosome partitioning protein
VLELVRKGELSAGHGRALLTAPNAIELAQRAMNEGLTVRQVEALSKGPSKAPPKANRAKPEKDADTRMIEGDLSAAIGMKVSIEHGAEGGGELRVRYKSLDQLDDLLRKLSE